MVGRIKQYFIQKCSHGLKLEGGASRVRGSGVDRLVLRDHVLRLIRRRDLSLSFCLEGGSGCEDVLLEIALLDEIFKVLSERPVIRSSVSLVVVE